MAKKDKFNTDSIFGLLRLSLGFMFLWAFADKWIGLGFSTCFDSKTGVTTMLCDQSVLGGHSSTFDFLHNLSKDNLFYDFFHSLATNPMVDFLFMFTLMILGVGLMLGVLVRIASILGILLMIAMWASLLNLNGGTSNPFVDYHIVYLLAMFGILITNKNQKFGLGKWWQSQNVVKKYQWLE